MSTFNNYDDLVESIAGWLMRGDLTAQIPQFIRMCESRLSRNLRVKEMVERRVAVADSQYITLPRNWRAARNVQRMSDRQPLEYSSLDEIDKYRAEILKTGCADPFLPTRYSILGTAMELAPAPTEDNPLELEMIYYANVPTLSEELPDSWLLREYPDLYLYGALIHSAPFLKDDARVALWESMFTSLLLEANASDEKAKRSGAPMIRRISGFKGT